jgi:hypothetical protein
VDDGPDSIIRAWHFPYDDMAETNAVLVLLSASLVGIVSPFLLWLPVGSSPVPVNRGSLEWYKILLEYSNQYL